MSNRFEGSLSVAAAPAASAPFFEMRVGAGRRIYLEELCVTINAATATRVALSRATAQGVGGASTMTGQPEDPNNPATSITTLAVNAFSTAPTFSTTANIFRRFSIPATIGAGITWYWPASDRFIVQANSSLVLWNLGAAAAAAAIDIYAVWTE